MKKEGYYSSGEFMKLANITKKTIRYYDEKNILKPSFVDENGARFYTDKDLAKLQQIMLLKYLGFSLSDIKELQVADADKHFINNSLNIQLKLVEDRIEQLQMVAGTIREATDNMSDDTDIDWGKLFAQIHVTDLETTLKNQYKDASNIMARINLHKLYSTNKYGWFKWAFDNIGMKKNQKILELGCGAGNIWVENLDRVRKDVHIVVSDISDGMLRDARRNIENAAEKISENPANKTALDVEKVFDFKICGCEDIPFDDNSFDVVIANHVLFYCEDIDAACKEIKRVLKPGGKFICGTYGKSHMVEVSELVREYDANIILAAENLYERFGKENGVDLLKNYFDDVKWQQYEDSLFVTEPEPIISYVLSCHGNQNQYISDRYKEFRSFMKKKVEKGFKITKDAGVFIAVRA